MMIMKRVPSCLVRGGRHAVNAARRQHQYRTGPAGCAATLVLFSPRRRVRRGTGALAPIAREIADTSLELPRRAGARRRRQQSREICSGNGHNACRRRERELTAPHDNRPDP
ncbi:hypothetical protein [Burkholderia glumae]|uniref:Uncharacterized protein n=1 Tax=Burkholderia glumae TaxID=337 RepID=A0AAP9XY90_BURGL|nr:hypothetical protein [Burkholderia glumae]MCM2485488.1 hypothetical protein [Burkholderia glumae]MCM2511182.1 hypothetical protein [Burkholderia glumae]MCM2541060.1 hypothetical protein [Burkholderia glumae]QPQ90214.1 hypothetical protein I6H06_11625 [Burkholderia glumae]QQM94044.1 hypothetical protein I6G78_19725 [Burkholderia glumae]